MSIRAGSILHVAGHNVIDRLQSAGLGNVSIDVETVREVGNYEVVDKIPTEPDFTFSMESWDVSTDTLAWLTGKVGSQASASAPGSSDPAGTGYSWLDCSYVNIPSPWKDVSTGSAGNISAGHLIPGYYPTSLSYSFGVTDNASQTLELAGGSFYYSENAPVEETQTGDGATTAFSTTDPVVLHRKGGPGSTDLRYVFGVIVGKQTMVENSDYTVSVAGGIATITFNTAPANGAAIRFSYFTTAAKAYPQTVHASTIVKPGAIRGRDIHVYIGASPNRVRLGGIQSLELNATIEGEVERELGNDEVVGRSVTGTDTSGTITVRSKDIKAFFDTLGRLTGVTAGEVIGFLNQNAVPLEILLKNPKTGDTIKTIYVSDAIFQIPGTPGQANTPTDFQLTWDSKRGFFEEYKGDRAGGPDAA